MYRNRVGFLICSVVWVDNTVPFVFGFSNDDENNL